MRELRLALAQINPVVGDLRGNVEKVLAGMGRAESLQVDLLAFPELTLTGYPPEDLLRRPQFIADNLACLDEVRRAAQGPMVVVVGFVDRQDDIYNAAAVLQEQRLAGVYHKRLLPNYGVFDEKRYFHSSEDNCVFQLGEVPWGISICEDIWLPNGPFQEQATAGGALLLLNLSASPYHAGKPAERWELFSSRARDTASVVAVVNLVGGQDELIFDGASVVVGPSTEPIARGQLFQEDFIVADLDFQEAFQRRSESPRWHRGSDIGTRSPLRRIPLASRADTANKPTLPPRSEIPLPSREEEVYEALSLGTHDYVNKNGFQKVVIGLSGGVDSALTASIAVDALGAQRVITVGLPSQFSSNETRRDTQQLAENLGIQLLRIPIDEVYAAYKEALAPILGAHEMGVTEENIQSRIRGNLLMALSNYYGWLVLNTGNKSEASVGYCTLYGDMAGGLSIIKDLSKTMVYRLCRYRNERAKGAWIPESILQRPPSAELRPGQKDTDSLPEYDLLDKILQAYVEEEKPFQEILQLGLDEAVVREVIARVDHNEYKRRQSPPGLKITPRALGKDRRLPITNHYRIFEALKK